MIKDFTHIDTPVTWTTTLGRNYYGIIIKVINEEEVIIKDVKGDDYKKPFVLLTEITEDLIFNKIKKLSEEITDLSLFLEQTEF